MSIIINILWACVTFQMWLHLPRQVNDVINNPPDPSSVAGEGFPGGGRQLSVCGVLLCVCLCVYVCVCVFVW